MEVYYNGRNQSKQEGSYPFQSCGNSAEGKQVCQVIFLQNGGYKVMKKLYYISWNGTCARFTRCFDSKAERDKFEKDINPNKNISTWEKIIAD